MAFCALIVLSIPGRGNSTTDVAPGIQTDLDNSTLQAVLNTFRRADEAVQARDLERIMALYSEEYDYHGFKKADTRKVWTDLFEEFRDISNAHHLTKFTRVGSGSKTVVEVTCTGSLSGISKSSGLSIPIDSWSEEIHYLMFEDGRWRIRGNVGESPKTMPFGTAPHPLF
jgi:hypothetical protein